jgi:hypothetical protein
MSAPPARTCPGLPYFLQSTGLIQPLRWVPELFAEYVCPLDWTYPVKPYLTQTKSFLRTYLVRSPGSSSVLQTYPVLGPDLSDLLVLTQVKSQHRTCPVPRPGSRDISRTCPASSPRHVRISDTLTARFLLGAIKEGSCPLHSVGHSIDSNTF